MQIVGLMNRYLLFFLSVFILSLPFTLSAQNSGDNFVDPQREEELADRIQQYIDEFNQISASCTLQNRTSEANLASASYIRVLSQKVQLLNSNYQSVVFRWSAFTQSEQVDIANSEYLMDLMTQTEQLKQSVGETLTLQQNKCSAITDFIEAEQFILSQDTVYKSLYRNALQLSLVKQLAPQLEKVKAEEQVLFAKLQSNYEKSKAAAQLVPQFSSRAAILDKQYFTLKAQSEKIQAMEYKPPIARIKDYLLGLACVSVILLFINMFLSKLQAAKKARQALKKQKELFGNKGNGEDYPTI